MRLGDIALKDRDIKFSWGEDTFMGPKPKLIYNDGKGGHVTIPAGDNFMMTRYGYCDEQGLDHQEKALQVPQDDFTFEAWHYTTDDRGGSIFFDGSGNVTLNELGGEWLEVAREVGKDVGLPC